MITKKGGINLHSFVNSIYSYPRASAPAQKSTLGGKYKEIQTAYAAGHLTEEELLYLDTWLGGRQAWPQSDSFTGECL